MARRSEHTQEQIKEMVLKAAEVIVAEEGAAALTVRKIALEIGYTVGTIYMVFTNMPDLLMHLKGRTLDLLLTQLNDFQDEADVELRIRALALNYYHFAVNHFNRWSIIFEPTLSDQQEVPDWYQAKISQVFLPIETLFQQMRPDLSAEQAALAARTLWCGVHGVCMLSLQGSLSRAGLAANTETAVGVLVDNFIQGWKR
jgi:AcrR family transcriptional regulator